MKGKFPRLLSSEDSRVIAYQQEYSRQPQARDIGTSEKIGL